jgi:hypothetical protein
MKMMSDSSAMSGSRSHGRRRIASLNEPGAAFADAALSYGSFASASLLEGGRRRTSDGLG